MRDYFTILRDHRDYRLIWGGSVINLLGDGATWTALAWMAITLGDAKAVGVLAICYTLPVIIGGTFVGPIIDRFSRRFLLVSDSVLRAVVVASVPLAAWADSVHLWHLYIVAAVYGLLKIVPLGAVPAVVPDIVPKDKIHTAAALESIAFDAAQMIGPVLGGAMIAAWDAPAVLVFDALSYLLFAGCILAMKNRLPRPEHVKEGPGVLANFGWGPVFRLLRKDLVLLSITLAFALFNGAMGMMRVVQPWLASDILEGGATTLGIILGVNNGASLIGSILAGVIKPKDKQMRNIGLLQIVSGAALFLLFLPGLWPVLLAVAVNSLFSGPMTVSSQVIRVARIPVELRGRMMTFMRTLMNSTSPAGAALAGPMLVAGLYHPLIGLMVALAAGPGVVMALAFRNKSFTEELGLKPKTAEPAPANA
ncbi:MFS transporter [Virgisporangium aliadipatigenens]|uniref:MFS transporter n=1 Tax=Virgisporangium aliadipatigenens TaxID=741659 RepID=A0A8J4DRP8_9ACTN|nr:MFS transporter [Virgisporangium aliadipatigenens]GIJ48370.1 MFS transporter [Virgisporangium aliadipatigenens]